MDISGLLDDIKAAPYRDIEIYAPHSGLVKFLENREGDNIEGPHGQWKEKHGTPIATIEREKNIKTIYSPEKGSLRKIHSELENIFVEAGTTLAILRHKLTKQEVERIILKKALYLFCAPERAKYYFTPEVDKKIRSSDAQTVMVRDGMELLIMSRMKREAPLAYTGPDGIIYAIYFTYNENMDAGAPLIGVCPESQLNDIQEVIMRVQTEWQDQN